MRVRKLPPDQWRTDWSRTTISCSRGRATSYAIGLIEILRLRAAAEAALGDRFDLRDFHDTLLGSGSVPLPILGELVADWVAAQASMVLR